MRKGEKIDQVYVIQMGETNYFKIGFTTHLEQRLANIQVDCPLKLKLCYLIPGNETLEGAIQRRLSDYVTTGGAEWFRLDRGKLDSIIREFTDGDKIDELQPYRNLLQAVVEIDKKDDFPDDLKLSLKNVKRVSAISGEDISEALRGNLLPISYNGHIAALLVPYLSRKRHRDRLIKLLNELELED